MCVQSICAQVCVQVYLLFVCACSAPGEALRHCPPTFCVFHGVNVFRTKVRHLVVDQPRVVLHALCAGF